MNANEKREFHGREVGRRQMGSWTLVLTRYEPETVIPFHRHQEPYATVVLRGRYRERSGSVERECAASNIVIHGPGERHCDRFARVPTSCLNLYGGNFSKSAVIANPAGASIAAKLRAEFAEPDVFSSRIVNALMLESDAWSERCSDDRRRPPSWLRRVREEVEARFREPMTLSGLAASACVHPTHVARAFRRHYGMTLGEMIRLRRVEHSKTLLRSARPLAEVAGETGFADQSHFTRTFHRLTGTTPAAYRRDVRRRDVGGVGRRAGIPSTIRSANPVPFR
ncbi:MAG TPA: AraC family transcriptional regulator [Thermoanaerobaculia bacterium]|nr:AraC family transcriptional regulator [Thermoanaerobaculia bacterium]